MKNNKEFNKVVDIYIFTVIFLIILFYKSVRVLIEIFSYGILKKEILTEESNIGFDIKIKMKQYDQNFFHFIILNINLFYF